MSEKHLQKNYLKRLRIIKMATIGIQKTPILGYISCEQYIMLNQAILFIPILF